MYKRANKPRGKWMLLLHTYYLLPHAETDGHILYPFLFLLFFFETNDVAPLWLSPVDSLFSLTRVLYISIRWKKGTIEITHPKGESQINIHTRRTQRKEKGLCNNNFFPSVFWGFFFGLSGQMIDKCKFFFLVDILPTLFCPAHTHTHPAFYPSSSTCN
jgi:hypothetical protein